VDALLARADRAGGTIIRPAQRAAWGGYYVADPDGHLWKVAAGAGPGEFEPMVLLAIVRLRGEVYGVRIVVERRTARTVSRAAVYLALRRLEKKGLISTSMGDPTTERGGKRRREGGAGGRASAS